MAAPSDQISLVYTRLAQLAFLYLDAVRSSDHVRSSIALAMFQQAFVARRETIDIGWSQAGNAFTPTLDTALDRVRSNGVYDGPTSIAIAMVLVGALGSGYRAQVSSIPAILPGLAAWAASFVDMVSGDTNLRWLMEMAIDTFGVSAAALNTTIASYLQRPLTTRTAPSPAPTPPPAVVPGISPSRISPPPVPRSPDTTVRGGDVVFNVSGDRWKVSPWVIGGLVTLGVGAAVYLIWGSAKRSRRGRR